MEITKNEEKFEECQEEMLHYLAKRVRALLVEKGVDEELIYDITGDMVFEVGAIIDGSAIIGSEAKPVLPYLTFSKSEEERESLIASPIGSCFHEMAYGFVDQIFEEE
jgi:hypothetical protein